MGFLMPRNGEKMSDFVNKIKTKDGSEYAIHDERLNDIPSGGTKLYKHVISGLMMYESGSPTSLNPITIINDNNSPINSFSLFITAMCKSISSYIEDEQYKVKINLLSLYPSGSGAGNWDLADIEGGSIASHVIRTEDNISALTDTVTEL